MEMENIALITFGVKQKKKDKKRSIKNTQKLWETDLPFHKSLTRIVIHAELFLNNAPSL